VLILFCDYLSDFILKFSKHDLPHPTLDCSPPLRLPLSHIASYTSLMDQSQRIDPLTQLDHNNTPEETRTNNDFATDIDSDQEDDHNLQDVDITMLISDLHTITTNTNKILSSIQHSVEYSSRAAVLMTELATAQIDELGLLVETFNQQIQCIVQLFTTLNVKLSQLSIIIDQLPSYEQELDGIIQHLPYLQQRVKYVVNGIKKGTHVFTPPSKEKQLEWENNIDNKVQQITAPTNIVVMGNNNAKQHQTRHHPK